MPRRRTLLFATHPANGDGASPNVFVVPAQSEIKSTKEFIDKAGLKIP
jgi:hypothetical protein